MNPVDTPVAPLPFDFSTKPCTKCKTVKSLSAFGSNGKYIHAWCRECKRKDAVVRRREDPEAGYFAHIKAKYGVTRLEYAALVAVQHNSCAICGEKCKRYKRLSVDHDHATGKVRGLLCQECNHGIGKFGDDPDRLRKAAIYLETK